MNENGYKSGDERKILFYQTRVKIIKYFEVNNDNRITKYYYLVSNMNVLMKI